MKQRQITAAEARRLEGADTTEKQFMADVMARAKLGRWRVFHVWLSLHSTAGFPDLVLVRRGRLVFAELKKVGGKLSAEQRGWLEDLAATNTETYVWSPEDWRQIERVLR